MPIPPPSPTFPTLEGFFPPIEFRRSDRAKRIKFFFEFITRIPRFECNFPFYLLICFLSPIFFFSNNVFFSVTFPMASTIVFCLIYTPDWRWGKSQAHQLPCNKSRLRHDCGQIWPIPEQSTQIIRGYKEERYQKKDKRNEVKN